MQRFFLFCILLLLALSTGLFVSEKTFSEIHIGVLKSVKEAVATKPIEQTLPTSIRFVGDVMLARNVEFLMKTYSPEYPFSHLQTYSTSSLLLGNFEGAIPQTHVPTPSFTFAFSVDKSFIPQLTKNGFTHMGLANNHSLDFGESAYSNTHEVLLDNQVVAFGHPHADKTASQYIAVQDALLKVIALSAVDTVPSNEQLSKLFATNEEDTVVIAYIHWGTEYAPIHNATQQKLAHTLIDTYGVDVIIGHHPHVVQDIELYNGALIFYSLGNFIFDQYFSNEVQEGLMVEMNSVDSNLVFTLLPYSSINSLSAPYQLGMYEKDLFLEDLQKKSSPELHDMILRGEIVTQKR